MKIIFTGAEYHLSSFLNCLKIPLVLLIVVSLIASFIDCMDNNKPFKESLIGRNWKFYAIWSLFTTAYMFLIWT